MNSTRVIPVLLFLLFAGAADAAARPKQIEGVVNLNTASAQELQMLPGVGPAKAEAIVAYRRAHPFRTVDELARIKGIGRKMIRKLRVHLTVSGETTARPAASAPPPEIKTER